MSEQPAEEPRTQVILIDDGGWVSQTFIHEVKTNRPDVDIADIIKVPPECPLKEILDKIPTPDEIVVDEETGEVQDKTTLWLPFTYEGCLKRNLHEELNALQQTGEYPYLSVDLHYGQMARPWLHELARKAKIVPMDHMVTEDGKSVQAPKKLTQGMVLVQGFQNKAKGKFKIKVLKAHVAEETKEKTTLDQIKENKDEGKLYPAETGISEEGNGVDTKKKKVNINK